MLPPRELRISLSDHLLYLSVVLEDFKEACIQDEHRLVSILPPSVTLMEDNPPDRKSKTFIMTGKTSEFSWGQDLLIALDSVEEGGTRSQDRPADVLSSTTDSGKI
jgi:hypothetical protein